MFPRPIARVVALFTLAWLVPHAGAAQLRPSALRVSKLVGDGMVMQRGAAVPVWGWASPGERVTVTFAGRPHVATADASGAWKATLPARPAGGPFEMTIAAQGNEIRVHDVLVGDVWICSGQSNMELTVSQARDGAAEVAAANDPQLRQFKVPQSWSLRPEDDVVGGSWERADSAHAGAFTAVGYFFARELRKSPAMRRVPIGLINTSWGGSRIEPWMNARTARLTSAAVDSIMRGEQETQRVASARLAARLGGAPTVDAGMAGGRAVWADPALDDTGWSTIAVPSLWEAVGYAEMDGVAWYRTSFELTPADAAAPVRIGLGQIDDSDESWVNGVRIGGMTNSYNVPRVYAVPPSALHVGRNVIAVRVEDSGGGGGIWGDSSFLFLDVGGARRPLAGAWKFRVGILAMAPGGQRNNQIPTILYNRMIHPLLPYPIRGALWYQGESNANDVADASRYREQLPAMIRQWRAEWQRGDFPFLWVQLPNFMAPDSQPRLESAWATLRESQASTLALPKTGQVVAIDIGESGDIHPKNKQDVGARMALVARHVAYGEPVIASGPTFRAMTVAGDRATLSFANLGGGLVAHGAGATIAPHAFAIAGADHHFVWAEARLVGNRVEVRSAAVPHPIAVRYAWGDDPEGANLFNRAGLPAAPFRTDTW